MWSELVEILSGIAAETEREAEIDREAEGQADREAEEQQATAWSGAAGDSDTRRLTRDDDEQWGEEDDDGECMRDLEPKKADERDGDEDL